MKRLASMLLAAAILLTAISGLTFTASAESLYIRKIVSVVYDDSGSMEGDKWAYANYAMQAFCGMLNSEDQLFITYMSHSQTTSNYDPEESDLSASGIQNSVDTIRAHTDSGSTPYTAVKVAFDKLKSVQDSNPNTQYWLVVITDGEFDECQYMSDNQMQRFLDDSFEDFTNATMPNGTNPQVTFLGIGNVAAPKEDLNKGIYTFTAKSADGIIAAMSEMADRISGRTRLGTGDIMMVDDKTIQVSSTIPLLNIAVFTQGTDAVITDADYGNEVKIPLSRKASLRYPNYDKLNGGAYLLGDAQKVIGSGTYTITFDKAVDLQKVIILFEPALEMRMTISVNGTEITDYNQLKDVMEGDKVSVSCKIYEMGTNKEVDASLMPPGTKFEISVSEEGNVVKKESGQNMTLADYVVKNVETEITAAVIIEGFRPIAYTEKFTPLQYVPKVVYSVTPSFGSDARNVRFDSIASNKDLTVCFTVYADGTAITDPNAVKALNPVITVSPQGNDGMVSYSNDGKIVFTPNAASMTTASDGSCVVEVTCTLEDGTSAAESYTVLISDYQVISTGAKNPVKKTGFYANQESVSFYITKDGEKLDQQAVEKNLSIALNEVHRQLETDIAVAPDGTITVSPYTSEEHRLTFWNWWTNWAYYFGLSGDDVEVTLQHGFGTGTAFIDVVEEDLTYQILNVYLPLLIEVVVLGFLITWIVLVVTKPRYAKTAVLYVGEIRYNRSSRTHMIRNFSAVRLEKFNRIKKGNGRLKFKRTADIVSANGVSIRADHGGRVICEMAFPWFKGKPRPVNVDFVNLNTPAEICEYVQRHRKLEIEEFAMTETVEDEFMRGMVPSNPQTAKYIVVPNSSGGVAVIEERRVIRSGKIFVYVNG